MEHDNEDWKSTANDFISSIIQIYHEEQKNTAALNVDQCKERAFELLEVIKECTEDTSIRISFIMDALHTHFAEEKDLQAIADIFLSREVQHQCKIHLIQLINIILGKSSTNYDENVEEAETIYEALMEKEYGRDQGGNPNRISIADRFDPFWDKISSSIQVEGEAIRRISRTPSGRDIIDADAVSKAGDYVSEKIYGGAKLLSSSMTPIVPKVTNFIETLGEYAKQNIEPHSKVEELATEKDDGDNFGDHSVAVTEAAVNATNSFRESAKMVAFGIRDYGAQGINALADVWKQHEVGKELCPEPELRESFVFAGKVSLATIAATVELAESLFEVSKAGKF